MKKGLLFISLLTTLGLASCNTNNGGQTGGDYTLTTLETNAIQFLSVRGVTIDKLEPIHVINDSDVLVWNASGSSSCWNDN